MDLRDSLCRFYYDSTVSDLRQVNKTGGGELSYNSIMYLDVISYQQALGVCTVTTLADTILGRAHRKKSRVGERVIKIRSCCVILKILLILLAEYV